MALPSKGNILVTGGAGFIGSALVWALNETGYENIIVCDRLGTDEKWKNLVPLRYADYIDADDLIEGVKRGTNFLGDIGAVFHLGGVFGDDGAGRAVLDAQQLRIHQDLGRVGAG